MLNNFFFRKRTVYGIKWTNTVQQDRPQIAM